MTLAESNAFPEDKASGCLRSGLTKREYFAIRCLEGALSNEQSVKYGQDKVVKVAVEFADLLIAELNKD